MVLTVYALIAASFIYVVYVHISTYLKRRSYSHIPSFPIPLTWRWYLGNLYLIRKKGSEMGLEGSSFSMSKVAEALRKELETESYVIFFPGIALVYTVSIPVVSKVFSDHKTFLKEDPRAGNLAYVNGERVFGHNGILTEAGTDVWYYKRKMMDPAFQKKFLKCLMGDMTNSANKLCQYLEGKKSQNAIDIFGIMNRVALEVVCTCGFSLKDDFIMRETSDLNKATETIFEALTLNFRTRGFSFRLPWTFREEKRRLKDACALIRGTMRALLAERIKKNSEDPESISNDVLDHIIKGNKFSDKISIEDICDDFFAFLVAGMETTAITMSITIWLLLKHPEISQKVVEEVNEVYGEKDELDYEDLNRLVFLEQCIKECLRMHPPAQLSSRVSPKHDVTINGLLIPGKSIIMLPTEAIQSLEAHWPDPHIFDPDRFAPGKKIEPFTYFPFTAGPRQCIGKHFAIMEAKVVLAKFYRTFNYYDPYPEEKILEKKSTLTAKPKNGVFIGIEH
ncbi:cholesterol 24-hydroxylase-like [Bolinopsis microptera]|uniref:cholesterol 24-hydroxylase-like n=1 Tax=Bolinopsis microptera TaxID=2820187 RepID=UPI0030796AD7